MKAFAAFIDSPLFHLGKHGALNSAREAMIIQKLSAFFLDISYRFVAQQPHMLPTPQVVHPCICGVHQFLLTTLPKCREPAVVLGVAPEAEQVEGALPLWGHHAYATRRWKAVETLWWKVHQWSGLGPSVLLFCFKSTKNSCPMDWILCPQQIPAGFSQTYTWSHIFLCAVEWK